MGEQQTNAGGAKMTALVTGASGGIGLELARLFAEDGHDLVLVARSADKLSSLADELKDKHNVRVRVLPADLARPEAAREIFDELQREGFSVDALVNNAGVGSYGLFAETDLQTELDLLQINVVALTHLTKLFLPAMIARRRGYLMQVASTAAFQPGPLMAVYYASKAYVLHFSEALSNETEGTGVIVSALCPGPTETGFVAAAGMEESKLFDRGPMTAREVAEAGYRGMLEGKRIVIPGFRNALVAHAVGLLPRGLVTKVVRGIQERRS
ncbi:MAG TPA: SDR family oxidoreductase [Pyrinomonadaceae bacterium]|jgi:short-subunit dehydrogenase|nr:SDR family oxidoreductase [Pyrinomonadaceae bacterium]